MKCRTQPQHQRQSKTTSVGTPSGIATRDQSSRSFTLFAQRAFIADRHAHQDCRGEENIEFFDTSLDAEQAGYRPCKRCKPRSPVLEDSRVALVRRACRTIEASEERPSLQELAAGAGLSSSRFHRIFKELTGATPKQYADAVQAERMRAALHQGDSVTEAVYAAGFRSSSRFYEKWAWILGMKPSAYGGGGAGELIIFAVVESHLGMMIVATTRIGVCFIAFADDRDTLVEELSNRFHKATVVQGDSEFKAWVECVAQSIDAPDGFLDLPLDIQGTAFMRRVWSALRKIPAGQTRSYSGDCQSDRPAGRDSRCRQCLRDEFVGHRHTVPSRRPE